MCASNSHPVTLLNSDRVVDNAVREHEISNLHHLRRFVKPEHLPTHLRGDEERTVHVESQISPRLSIEKPTNDGIATSTSTNESSEDASQQPVLHFLICSSSLISHKDLQILLSSVDLPDGIDSLPQIRTIDVPLNGPTSHEQAKAWSETYWPSVYKGGNPHGPHPSILARATVEIQDRAGEYMALAMRAGSAAAEQGIGEAVGAAVVARKGSETPSVIAVTGDARWNGIPRPEAGGIENGNAMAHAVMRVISMIARQRTRLLHGSSPSTTDESKLKFFADMPLTPFEKDIYSASTLAPGGYLCLDLELYLTHEPCLMCSMAILHSRFGRVVFGQGMPRTGGFVAGDPKSNEGKAGDLERREGYGLWWRPELNWKLLAWQWVDDVSSHSGDDGNEALHA